MPNPTTPTRPVSDTPAQPNAKTPAQTTTTPASPPAPAVFPISPADAKDLSLSAPQILAIELMLSGNTIIAAATAAGVTRRTLYNWLHRDHRFQAAYHAWQHDALTSARSKLLAAADDAVVTVADAVKRDGKLAFAVLKSLGIADRPTPGSTNPDEIKEQMDLERQHAQAIKDEENFNASIGIRPNRK